VATDFRDDVLEALLISRAKDCDAAASEVASVSSLGVVGVAADFILLFLAPRFRRLLVDGDLESMPSMSIS
jgi:hypothetical protein